MFLEQFRRAHFALFRELFAHLVSAITRLGALEVITLLVERKALYVLACIFQRLAKREADMDAVHKSELGPLGLRAHCIHLTMGESIGL